MKKADIKDTEKQSDILFITDCEALKLIKEYTGKELKRNTLQVYAHRLLLPKPLYYQGVMYFNKQDFMIYLVNNLVKRKNAA